MIGSIVAERYRLEQLLGEGAMGAVYLAEHVHMRKRFALKLLHPEAMGSPEIVARFEREAVAAGNISHPNIAAASDFGRLADGSFFLVLEYVAGRSLRHLLQDGAVHPARALVIARQILGALGAAHARGIVHRDIKPENAMLVARDDGVDVVKLLDFGIAKLDANSMTDSENGDPSSPLTRMGAIYGTPAYMAPEQAMGLPIDGRADLYAVGVMLFELIAGVPPFSGDGMIVIAKQVNDAPPTLTSPIAESAIGPELRQLVASLLEKDRDRRPADAPAALALLHAAAAAMPTDPQGMASAATLYGETPLVTAATPRPPSARGGTLIARMNVMAKRAARRVGITERQLYGAAAGVGVLLLLLIVLLAVRSRPSADDDDAPRRHHAVATAPASASKGATTNTKAPPPPAPTSRPTVTDAAPAATSAPPAKKTGGGGGGGIVNKIKSIFH